ncbi:hypothetical protein HNE_1267 [Hyphomonas neptunium ATCC 15444]|uniref:Uncharacterized protein n=2 Tax=Hyphomonadaceae TaxID=69657 RepID=Q0C2Q8_HYPNA|nr:hypothetical protein HNE_1267 [Hyphomonas neptunium ATCC 15444]
MGFLSGGLRALAAALLVLAVAVRVVVPAGYMVGEDTSGQMQIELCTEHGVVSRTIDLATGEYVEPGGDVPAEGDQKAADGCVFAAGVQIAVPLNDAPDLAQLRVIGEAGLHHPVAFEIARRLAAPLLYPTGPPASL